MRAYPNSAHVRDAQEHLDYHKLRRDLSLAAFRAFLEKYPGSKLADGVRDRLEPMAFDAARAQGTVAAYERFLNEFPGGSQAARARGNMVFLAAGGFGSLPDQLAAFADEHPESDFANEARRSAESTAVREQSRFRGVGLEIEIAPGIPEAARLRALFREKAEEMYKAADIRLVEIPELIDESMRLPAARLSILHSEQPVKTEIDQGDVSRPGMLATTRVSLRRDANAPAIFEREFSLRIDQQEHIASSSVLFSARAPHYWDSFFVPVATWETRSAVRDRVALERQPVDIDAAGDRSVVLYEDGSFDLTELADPSKPVVLASFERPEDFKKWSGVRILGDRVAIFGEEGIEFVQFGPAGPVVVGRRDRAEIGTVFAVEAIGDKVVVAGARGLLMLSQQEGGEMRRLMRRVVKGLAVVEDTLIFTDGESLFVSTLPLIAKGRVTAQMKLGRVFGLHTVESFDDLAVAIGEEGVLVMNLQNPSKPVVTAKLPARQVGIVGDATAIGGRIFLVGSRGIQMLDPGGHRIAESIDVENPWRVARMGRHVVSIGEQSLQVVDSTPFLLRAVPAAQSQTAPPAPAPPEQQDAPAAAEEEDAAGGWR